MTNAGAGVDTMLKMLDGYAYLFVMAAGGHTGRRTFNLPGGLMATAEVVDENRTVQVVGGAIEDTFINDYDYHIYKIPVDPAPGDVWQMSGGTLRKANG